MTNTIANILNPTPSFDDFDKLKNEVEHLKKLHDHQYARKCILGDLEKKYNSMIRTDVWYDAAKEYLNKNIDTYKFNLLINAIDIEKNYFLYLNSVNSNYIDSCADIEFNTRDGADSENNISIKELHNAYPDVELEDDFKQFCVEYKNNEK